jgi:predicted Rossmann fold nucleotide-binding protein DprA/Smf involved in DNA uptake
MEARDVLENVRDSAEGFLHTVSRDAAKELDVAELKAHLAKMDAEDKWEETQKELTHLYGESKVEVEKLARKAGEEINDIMVKLSKVV